MPHATRRVALAAALAGATLVWHVPTAALDCNGNGRDDDLDLRETSSLDCDGNGLPDECDGISSFHLGGAMLPPGTFAISLGAGDLNRDGIPDFAGAVTGGGVFILPGEGRGAFARVPQILEGGGASAMALGDLDGDEDLDLVTLEPGRGAFSTRVNQGTGVFGHPEAHEVGRPPVALVLIDLDGDGDLDAALASEPARGAATEAERASTAAVVQNQGGGQFGAPLHHPVSPSPAALASGDFNGDGRMDIATASRAEPLISVLWGRKDAASPERVDFQLTTSATALAAADVASDDRLDLIVAHDRSPDTSESLSLGSFSAMGDSLQRSGLRVALDVEAKSVIAADLDTDGEADLVTVCANQILLAVGPGRLRNPATLSLAPAASPGSAVTIDLDGDARLDIALAEAAANHLPIIWNRGEWNWIAPGTLPVGPSGGPIVAADLDGSGNDDLLLPSDRDDDLVLLRHQGEGDFRPPELLRLPSAPQCLLATDLDRDGDLDIAAGGAFGLARLENDGRGVLSRQRDQALPAEAVEIAAGDLDGDGVPDLATLNVSLVSSFPRTVSVILSTGGGEVRPPRNYLAPAECRGLAISRIDADDRPDLALAAAAGLHVQRNEGGGRFGPSELAVALAGSGLGRLMPRDLDADGEEDLAAAARAAVALLWREPADWRLVLASVPTPRTRSILSLASADLDGDADADLVAATRAEDSLLLLFNGGDRTLAPVGMPTGGGAPSSACAFTAGGALRPLIAVAHRGTPAVRIVHQGLDLHGGIPGAFGPCHAAPAFRRGDVDADGITTVTDAVITLRLLFAGGEPPACLKAADTNDDGRLEITDALVILRRLFLVGPPPAPPFPGCGTDSTPDALPCAMGCV